MGVDLRPYISDDYPNAGQSIGNTDPSWAYDCQIECLKITARDYGLGTPYTDSGLRSLGQPQAGNSGMLFPTIQAIAAKAYPSLASVMTIQTGNAATLRANISKGYMQHMAFWCDANAWVPAQGPVTYSHCCRVVADTGTGFWFQNPEPHPDFFLTDAQVNSLTDGEGVLVFGKSLIPQPKIIAPPGGSMGAVAFTYRPSNFGVVVDFFRIDPATNHVIHSWGGSSNSLSREDLGGWADPKEGVSCGWSPTGDALLVQIVGADAQVWTNWWSAGSWHGWGHALENGKPMTVLVPPDTQGPAGPKGDKGDPGTTLDQATVDAMVKASVEADVAPAIVPAVQAALDPKSVAAAIEAAMKQVTGS